MQRLYKKYRDGNDRTQLDMFTFIHLFAHSTIAAENVICMSGTIPTTKEATVNESDVLPHGALHLISCFLDT